MKELKFILSMILRDILCKEIFLSASRALASASRQSAEYQKPPHAAKVLKANFPSSFTVFLGLSVFSAIFKQISLKSQKSKKFQKSQKVPKVPKSP